ncbi:Predicted DNA-binding transcriptional regulator YafY, contains an HTH and WYL domains [Saccharopolyspora kobensis]|uniref:Predicted DNA-binding transcriptional regulator YafY, contains an HTH and WYL domains n=1 Tax=Saccharopolyspora kobensis TaxID=146035 RepID=A0A1H6D2D6_9PSEU|nr:WYL domain-containing protein [Saccharopolyspora kobensis]SEG79472.1 Predicted DNA-binding transcriptional regulator YafY, contains an HTH and WYL domains [Saccharopolyspora kobensis]SFD08358.1 Predicted DNA-binding transcriptional regulator YafY, contains an HTH and WYL domains [Saccharopolyspora kobensis]
MRADRLVAALLLLQARGRMTAADLAEELEVSVATARRDLEALSAAGIPVYPQQGRGGGWSLVGGARTDLSGLNAAESQALFALLGPASSAAPELTSALRKLIRALPATFRADAEAAAAAVVSDPARWGERSRKPPELLERLRNATVRRLKVRLTHGSSAERLVDPLGLIDKDGIWYLIADTEAGRRTFRVDRIAAATTAEQPAERPDDFDLAAEWQRVVADVEQRRSLVSAVVLVDAELFPVLCKHFGRHCDPIGAEAGRVRARVTAHLARSLAEQLAGWGAAVEVLEPESVRRELARIGHDLTERYAT